MSNLNSLGLFLLINLIFFMNKYSKYLAPALALSMFAAVALIAFGQFDVSRQIAVVGSSANVQSVGVDSVSDTKVVLPGKIPSNPSRDCFSALLPQGTKFESVRCDGTTGKWIAVKNLSGIGTGDNGGIGVSGTGDIGVQGFYPGRSATGTAVKAIQEGFGYGFFQQGEQAKNRIEGSLSLGFGDMSPLVQAKDVKIQIDGGLRFSSGKDHYACIEDLRGTLWFTQESSGVADYIEVCAKNADGSYSWKKL